MDFAKECLYDTNWQMLRVNLLSENNDYGGWWSDFGAPRNADIILNYVYEHRPGSPEFAVRVWRALNLLNAVLLGYGERVDKPTTWESVRRVRDDMSLLHEKYPLPANFAWNWNDQADLLRMRKLKDLSILLLDLRARSRRAKRKKGTVKFRPELIKYISLIEAAIRAKS